MSEKDAIVLGAGLAALALGLVPPANAGAESLEKQSADVQTAFVVELSRLEAKVTGRDVESDLNPSEPRGRPRGPLGRAQSARLSMRRVLPR